MVLNQTYAGQVDGGDVRWINTATSLVRSAAAWQRLPVH
jgi:hypothetical protein